MSGRPETIRVLHVDDDPDLSDLVKTYLERENERFDVHTAIGPEEGLEILADREVDCIVSDYNMPQTNGIEFLELVREEYADLPFILYTGKGSEAVASEAISAGVTDYLQKESGSSQYTVLANRITNVVDRYRSRRAVEETERKLAEIADRTHDVLFMFDGQWEELLFINSSYEDVWGGSIAELRADPQSFLEMIHPEDRPKARRSVERLTDGESDTIEYRVETPAESGYRWIRGETKPIFDSDGTVDRIVGFTRDITEEKTRERELQRKERRYQAVFNDPNILVGLVDPDGTALEINQTAMEYVDVAFEALSGNPFWETPWFDHSEAVRREVEAWIDRAAGGEYVGIETELTHPDGTPYTVEGVFRPVTDETGEVVSILMSGRDVTERKDRERELGHTKQRLDLAMQEAGAGVWEWNLETDSLYWSDELLDLLGISGEEFDGEFDSFEQRLHPEDVDRVEAAIEEAIQTDGQYQVEQRIADEDGEYVWLDVRGTLVEDGDAQVMVGIGIGITERKAAETD